MHLVEEVFRRRATVVNWTPATGRDSLGVVLWMYLMNEQGPRPHPARWVPTLYFAEGLPFYAVSLMALLFYQRMGLRNDVIAFTTSLLGLPWSLKPLWSPF